MFCYIFRKSNLSDHLDLTEHMKHLQCRSTEEMSIESAHYQALCIAL